MKRILTQDVCEHIAGIFEKEGSDAWYIRPLSELVPAESRLPRGAAKGILLERKIFSTSGLTPE